MKRGLTGYYHTTRVGGEEVRAFVPHPLPPHPPLELTGSRVRKTAGQHLPAAA